MIDCNNVSIDNVIDCNVSIVVVIDLAVDEEGEHFDLVLARQRHLQHGLEQRPAGRSRDRSSLPVLLIRIWILRVFGWKYFYK